VVREARPAAPAPAPKAAPAKAAPAKAAPPSNGSSAPPYDPSKPRLRPANAGADKQQRDRQVKKAKQQVADLEKQIGERETAVRELEQRMSSPGFYDDRAAAEKAVADRQRLLDEVTALMAQWESLQSIVEANA
jgi:predicted phage-related endonuclease